MFQKCGSGRHEDFQSSCRTETMCHHRSYLYLFKRLTPVRSTPFSDYSAKLWKAEPSLHRFDFSSRLAKRLKSPMNSKASSGESGLNSCALGFRSASCYNKRSRTLTTIFKNDNSSNRHSGSRCKRLHFC